jgi:glycosyltransferase involved in cell wall biosynthesis
MIHLCIETESIKRDEKLRTKIRKEFGIKDKDIVIGNVARMVEMKGQEYLIKAFQQVSGKFPDATLMIAGSGKLERNLHKLVQSLDINDYVIFTGFRDDMQAVYSAFDIYAHTSVEGGGETFPYAVLYSLAQELPVVVSKVGDVPVMVVEGINGFVVPDKNPEAIAKKLSILLDNKDIREKMGRASLNHLKRNFTVEKMAEEIEKVYHKVSAHTNKE